MDYAPRRVHPLEQAAPPPPPPPQQGMQPPPQYPPSNKYVMLDPHQNSMRPPPYRRNIPRYHSSHHEDSGGSCCLRCLCCCCCFLFLVAILIGLLAVYIVTVIQPKVPSYKVDKFETAAFDMQPDFSLYTEFVVTIKADNPNQNIGFKYGKDSSVRVNYQETTLCNGPVPSFYQGVKNVSMIKISLKGKSPFGSGIQEAFMENRHTGRIPLLVSVKVPVSVVVMDIPSWEINVLVNCSLVVDSLTPTKKTGIISNVCAPKAEI